MWLLSWKVIAYARKYVMNFEGDCLQFDMCLCMKKCDEFWGWLFAIRYVFMHENMWWILRVIVCNSVCTYARRNVMNFWGWLFAIRCVLMHEEMWWIFEGDYVLNMWIKWKSKGVVLQYYLLKKYNARSIFVDCSLAYCPNYSI